MKKKKLLFKTPLFYQNRVLAGFFGQLEYHNRILQQVKSVLPAALAKHTLHCLVNDKRLLVYTDAAVWATQLRFYQANILASTNNVVSSKVDTVQIKIITEQTGVTLQPQVPVKIPSMATINVIQNDSLSVSDKHLQVSLQKLTSTLTRLAKDHKP